jgi:GNAT superfamily N-acetyltransferase
MDPRWHPRPAVPSDYDTFVRLFPELGVDDPIPPPDKWEADLLPGILIIEHEGTPVAYTWGRPGGEVGRILHVVVDPAFRGRGAGGAVMDAMALRLRAAGCKRWNLNVKVGNTPAIRLYERFGMRSAYRSAAVRLPWEGVARLPRDSAPVTVRPIEPGEQVALEEAFGVATGRLADFRKLGRILLRLAHPADPDEKRVGFTSFDPAFPGCYPFQVARPALAAPLLDAVRTHARPGDTYLTMLCERDDALVAALRDAGASVLHELIHMEGELPAATS